MNDKTFGTAFSWDVPLDLHMVVNNIWDVVQTPAMVTRPALADPWQAMQEPAPHRNIPKALHFMVRRSCSVGQDYRSAVVMECTVINEGCHYDPELERDRYHTAIAASFYDEGHIWAEPVTEQIVLQALSAITRMLQAEYDMPTGFDPWRMETGRWKHQWART